MFTRLSNSWELVKESARVLRADEELMIFPIISSIGVIIVSATFLIPMFLANFFDFALRFQLVGLAVLFLFYMAQYFVIFFANTALVGAALIRIRGGDPTIKDGFNIALQRIGPILGYSLIAATVGMIIKTLSNRRGGLQRILVSLLGVAWNVATYLVVPVLAAENVGPVDAIKRSAHLLKQTWGEQVIGNLGLETFFGLIYVLIIVISLPIFIIFLVHNLYALAVISFLFLMILIVLIGLVNATLSGIYSAAVYQYAANGQTSSFFNQNLVKNAFRSK
jgi:Family of unknown function (DUF6159)